MKKIISLLCMAVLVIAMSACTNTDEKQQSESLVESDTQATIDANEESEDLSDAIQVAPIIVKQASIPIGEHNAGGEIKVYDTNTVEVSNFTYDGGAPDTYIALGNYDAEGNFVYKVIISNELNKTYDNESFSLILPSTVDINEYDAISVWCDQFSENFADAPLK